MKRFIEDALKETNTSKAEYWEDKLKADYYATTPYGSYYYNYIIPLGTYLYDIDLNKYDCLLHYLHL